MINTPFGTLPSPIKRPTIWCYGWPAFFYDFDTYLTEADDETLWWRNVAPRYCRAGNDNVTA